MAMATMAPEYPAPELEVARVLYINIGAPGHTAQEVGNGGGAHGA
jgi:hypothetical protein